jgi:hypothetical protein
MKHRRPAASGVGICGASPSNADQGGDSICIFYLQMHFEKFAVAVDDHRGPTASGVGSSDDAPCPSSQRRVKQQ